MKRIIFLLLPLIVVFLLFQCTKSEENEVLEQDSELIEMLDNIQFFSLEEFQSIGRNEQIKATSRSYGITTIPTSTTKLVVLCYNYGRDCYGVWGADSCADVNCDTGCSCSVLLKRPSRPARTSSSWNGSY